MCLSDPQKRSELLQTQTSPVLTPEKAAVYGQNHSLWKTSNRLKKKKKKLDSTPDGKSLNINNDKIIKLSL